MFRNMERNANGTVVWLSHGDFDVEFSTFHVSSKHPHLIEEIGGQGFNIIVWLQLAHNFIPRFRGNAQCFQGFFVLVSVH